MIGKNFGGPRSTQCGFRYRVFRRVPRAKRLQVRISRSHCTALRCCGCIEERPALFVIDCVQIMTLTALQGNIVHAIQSATPSLRNACRHDLTPLQFVWPALHR